MVYERARTRNPRGSSRSSNRARATPSNDRPTGLRFVRGRRRRERPIGATSQLDDSLHRLCRDAKNGKSGKFLLDPTRLSGREIERENSVRFIERTL